MDIATNDRIALAEANTTVQHDQDNDSSQGVLSGLLEGWSYMQLFITFVLLCATYDQGE
jgi:hypothetical protein